ncbi:MAG: low molecular weight protein-tyrosine-phosphatase [Rubrivivax sp.]
MWFRDRSERELRSRVLMVCTGNICRSPTAEAVLRSKIERAGLGRVVQVDSAGTTGYHAGEPPDARAQRHAKQRGYDLSALRARKVERADLERFDWVLAMDEGHLDWLQNLVPAGQGTRVGLLMEHARRFAGEREVPDPYYGAPAGFDRVLDLVEDACDGLLDRIATELDSGNFRIKA